MELPIMTWNIPKYIRLQEKLKRKIIRGDLKEGARLPSQREMMKAENVSYSTVMRVLQELELKGFICRIHGKGTFVGKGVGVEVHGNKPTLVIKSDITQIKTMYLVTNRPFLSDNEENGADAFNAHIITTEMTRGILEGAKMFGVKVENLYFPESEFENPEKLLKPYLDKEQIGFFFYNYSGFHHVVDLMRRRKTPYLVCAHQLALEEDINCIVTNVKKPYYHLVQELIEQGHTGIAFVDSASKQDKWSRPKLEGYKKALTENGIDIEGLYIFDTETCPDLTCDLTLQRFNEIKKVEKPLPTAFVCINDLRAFGVLNALHKEKIKVPTDAVVIGFDNLSQAATSSPPLTTFDRHLYMIGFEATRLLTRFIDEPALQPLVKIMNPKLIVRESCPY
jgi:DNA-binding LacI/PurR family transcriptional regulator/DNA-binding transcriptional regulator YhcF (GntR family)